MCCTCRLSLPSSHASGSMNPCNDQSRAAKMKPVSMGNPRHRCLISSSTLIRTSAWVLMYAIPSADEIDVELVGNLADDCDILRRRPLVEVHHTFVDDGVSDGIEPLPSGRFDRRKAVALVQGRHVFTQLGLCHLFLRY